MGPTARRVRVKGATDSVRSIQYEESGCARGYSLGISVSEISLGHEHIQEKKEIWHKTTQSRTDKNRKSLDSLAREHQTRGKPAWNAPAAIQHIDLWKRQGAPCTFRPAKLVLPRGLPTPSKIPRGRNARAPKREVRRSKERWDGPMSSDPTKDIRTQELR